MALLKYQKGTAKSEKEKREWDALSDLKCLPFLWKMYSFQKKTVQNPRATYPTYPAVKRPMKVPHGLDRWTSGPFLNWLGWQYWISVSGIIVAWMLSDDLSLCRLVSYSQAFWQLMCSIMAYSPTSWFDAVSASNKSGRLEYSIFVLYSNLFEYL